MAVNWCLARDSGYLPSRCRRQTPPSRACLSKRDSQSSGLTELSLRTKEGRPSYFDALLGEQYRSVYSRRQPWGIVHEDIERQLPLSCSWRGSIPSRALRTSKWPPSSHAGTVCPSIYVQGFPFIYTPLTAPDNHPRCRFKGRQPPSFSGACCNHDRFKESTGNS